MQRGSALFFILIFLAVFFLLGGVFLIFYFSGNSNKSANNSISLEASQSAQNIASNSGEISEAMPQEGKVYFAKKDGKLYFKFKDRIYFDQGNEFRQVSTSDDFSWQALLDAPKDIDYEFYYNEPFSFKEIPGTDNFFLVLRWDKKVGENSHIWEFPVYLFNSQEKKLTLLFKTDTKTDSTAFGGTTYKIPRIDKISSDGNYVSFNLFQCWNCGGHTPEYLAFDVKNKASKKLGFVTDFSWLSDGEFQYKMPKEIPCSETEGMSPDRCTEDPASAPFIKESF